MEYNLPKKEDCVFCNPDPDTIWELPEELPDELPLAYQPTGVTWGYLRKNINVIWDKYPVVKGHCLIVPAQHHETYLYVPKPVKIWCWHMVDIVSWFLHQRYGDITGLNIGTNLGEDAGQTIFHAHIHIIPRRKGDSEGRGGVRKAVDGEGEYGDMEQPKPPKLRKIPEGKEPPKPQMNKHGKD